MSDQGYVSPRMMGIMRPAGQVGGYQSRTPDPNQTRPEDAGYTGVNLQGRPNTSVADLRARMGPYVGGERLVDVYTPEQLASMATQPEAPAPQPKASKPSLADASAAVEEATRSG